MIVRHILWDRCLELFFLSHYGIYGHRSFNFLNSDFFSYYFHFFIVAIDSNIITAIITVIFY